MGADSMDQLGRHQRPAMLVRACDWPFSPGVKAPDTVFSGSTGNGLCVLDTNTWLSMLRSLLELVS